MDSLSVAINDSALPAPVVTNVEISVSEVVLNSHAVIRVSYFDSNGTPLDHKSIKMEGADYDSWGNDDNYVTTFALTNLGLTKKA